ncbi:MAG: cupin fold metalloprotein, WbuC family [Deltaproteobacteria bacterium]|nr:cupin fold metalloprotein, WbuC family [Deltaproteobacteria bacterium]
MATDHSDDFRGHASAIDALAAAGSTPGSGARGAETNDFRIERRDERSLVLRCTNYPARIDSAVIDRLREIARDHVGLDVRWCLHDHVSDPLQEMVIVFSRDVYHPPHRHSDRVESVRAVSGRGIAIGFDDRGAVAWSIRLDAGSTHAIRFESARHHAIIPLSDDFITHEIANGPFVEGMSTQYAKWAPDRADRERGIAYTRRLLNQLGIGESESSRHAFGLGASVAGAESGD